MLKYNKRRKPRFDNDKLISFKVFKFREYYLTNFVKSTKLSWKKLLIPISYNVN